MNHLRPVDLSRRTPFRGALRHNSMAQAGGDYCCPVSASTCPTRVRRGRLGFRLGLFRWGGATRLGAFELLRGGFHAVNSPAGHRVIRSDPHEGFSVLTIVRDERANALNAEHAQAIADGVRDSVARGDRSLVIAGEGRAFSAGADFGEVAGNTFRSALFDMLRSITAAPMPVVAAVNGHAIGAGLQLAIACDLRVVGPAATFAVPTARLGLAVDPWTIERLVALVGGGPARRLLMTCGRVGADDPAVAGLVDQRGSVEDAVALAADLASMAPLTLRYIKTTVDAFANGRHDSEAVTAAFDACWASDDFVEGLAAQAEKRPAVFNGT